MTILDKIVAEKRQEVARCEAETSTEALHARPEFTRPVVSARAALTAAGSTGIIAEFKRRSPSKGLINGTAEAGATTAGYVAAGAAVLSVLTDEPFFGGTPADLRAARAANPATPILRKDFIISEYQITEARAMGADLILLIASCLTPAEVVQFSEFAHALGLEVLLEVHDEAELRSHLTESVDLVGVNNRNLSTFVTDVDTSARLATLIPDHFVKVAESGLQHARTILDLREAGYQGFLIGETFMKTTDPAAALAGLVAELSGPVSASYAAMKIKICGMREAANLLAVADFDPDFLGFIFYPKSARYVGGRLDPAQMRSLPATIAKVGVFVDANLAEVQATTATYLLDYAQLHGHETPEYCQQARAAGLHLIKAFAVGETFDFESLVAYEPSCDYFLFDTKGALPGGNGTTFDWQILAGYTGTTPFLLSGGLGPDNLAALLNFYHPQLAGFDFNSHLETAPGVKDVAATGALLQQLHSANS